MKDINNRGNWTSEGEIYGTAVISSQFFFKLETSLKIKSINKNLEIL